jgi:acetolactate synthase-1/2/3 large subunit
MSVPEAIVQVLEESGIQAVFGMSGGNTAAIHDALANHTSSIRTVLVRNESLATSAAGAYARLSGRPGVALGQGSWLLGHGIVGTLEALLAGTPLILIADLSDGSPFSHHGPYQSGTGDYGSWDARMAFGGITKLVLQPRDPVQAVQCTQLAVKHALAGQPGPVALLFHSSSLTGEVGPTSVPRLYATAGYITAPLRSTPDVSAIARALREAKRPILLAGGGVCLAGAQLELLAVAMAAGTPVVTTASGKGAFAEDHPLAAGVFGNFGSPFANETLGRADTVVVIGSKLGPNDTANESLELLDPLRQQIIQIDVEPRNASWTIPAEFVVNADARTALGSLLRDLEADPIDSRQANGRLSSFTAARAKARASSTSAASNATPIHPQRIISDLRRALPNDAIVCADAGENRLLMGRYFEVREGGIYLQPAASGGMGYAIPAALGAKVRYPGRTVVAVCGDGGLGMSLPGLLTAIEEQIDILILVFNNHTLGWSKHGQLERGQPEFKASLGFFDYSKMATAIGFRAFRVTKADDLLPALRKAIHAPGPALVDVETSTEETYVNLRSPLLTPSAAKSTLRRPRSAA